MSNVAATIQSQIGNRAFTMMGAHNLIASPDALSFKVRGSRKANHIKVLLAGDDTYTVEFGKIGRNWSFKVAAEVAGVMVGNLHATIEAHTGLYLSL